MHEIVASGFSQVPGATPLLVTNKKEQYESQCHTHYHSSSILYKQNAQSCPKLTTR